MLARMERVDHSNTTGRNIKWDSHSGKAWEYLKNWTFNYHITQQLHSWTFSPEKWNLKLNSQKNVYTNVHSRLYSWSPQTEISPDVLQWVNKPWYTSTMEYHLAIKKKQPLRPRTWENLQVCKKSQSQNVVYHMIPLMQHFEMTKF